MSNPQQHAAEIRQDAVSDIFRNLACWPSTFGPCGNGCRRGAGRGGGPCVHYAQDQLASVTNADLAARFVAAVREARRLEAEVYELPAPEAIPTCLP